MTARPLAVAAALSIALSSGFPGCGIEDKHVPIGKLTATIEAGAELRWLNIFNGPGSIRLKPSTTDSIQVSAEVRVRASRRAEFPTAVLARDLSLEKAGDVATVSSRHHTESDSPFEIDFEIAAPARLQWTIMRAIGDATIEAEDNSVIANVAVGTIELTGRVRHLELIAAVGTVRADVESLGGGTMVATTGDVKCTVRESGPTERLELTTTTGSVEVELPPGANHDVELLAAMGSCDIVGAPGVKPIEGVLGRHAQGAVGRGGPPIYAAASVGSVRFVVRK